jgi:hypothetical protein
MAFDVMYLDARDLSQRPLRERRQRLEELVAGSELVFPVRRLALNGIEAWQDVLELDPVKGSLTRLGVTRLQVSEAQRPTTSPTGTAAFLPRIRGPGRIVECAILDSGA